MNSNCGSTACGCVGLLISVVFAAVIAILYAFGILAGAIATVVWIAFGFAVLGLILLFVALLQGATDDSASPLRFCLCRNTSCLLAGIIGTLLTTIIALFLNVVEVSIAGIVIIAIGSFFFALLIIGIIYFISCVVCRACPYRQ